MAEKVEELKNDFLTCPLCLQLYKDPKLLPCQHTFCLGCLEKYLTHNTFHLGECRCPYCMQTAHIPPNVCELPNNYLVMGLLQFVHRGARNDGRDEDQLLLPAHPPSDDCPVCEERRASEGFCLQCELWLCASCKRSHAKVPATKEHTVQPIHALHNASVEKLKQVEKLIYAMEEESDTHHASISRQRQVLSEQMSEATHAINFTTDQLQSVLEEKRNQLLGELWDKILIADDNLNKVLLQAELRRNQLQQLHSIIKEARGMSEVAPMVQLVSTLQRDIRGLLPLPAFSGVAKIQGVSFLPAPLLSPSLQAETLGHISTLQVPEDGEELFFPPGNSTLQFEKVPDTQRCTDIGFVTSVVAAGSCPEMIVFVTGNKGVYFCPPRLQFGVAKFHFTEMSIFCKPWGAVLTSDKKILITDAGFAPGEGFVAVFDIDGNFVRYLAKGLLMPRGIAFGSDGSVYVCDRDDRCIYVLDYRNNGTLKKVVKKNSEGRFLFLSPMEIAVAANGDIIVSDAGHFIKIFSPTFALKTVYKSPFPKSEFWGICTDTSGRVYVVDWNHGVHVLSSTTEAKFEGLLKGLGAASIIEPTSLTFRHASSHLYVGCSNMQIYKSVLV